MCVSCFFFATGLDSCLTCKLPSHEFKLMFQELLRCFAFKGQFPRRNWASWLLARLCTRGCELLHKKSPARCSRSSFIRSTTGATLATQKAKLFSEVVAVGAGVASISTNQAGRIASFASGASKICSGWLKLGISIPMMPQATWEHTACTLLRRHLQDKKPSMGIQAKCHETATLSAMP